MPKTVKDNDKVTLPTSLGDAEAVRESIFGGGRWKIGYPWGDDEFYGTKAEVISRMKKNIEQNDEVSQ